MSTERLKSALVITADERLSSLIQSQLTGSGWEVESAENTDQALKLLRGASWPLIFYSRTLLDGSCLAVEQLLDLLQPHAHIALLVEDKERDFFDTPVRNLFSGLILPPSQDRANADKLRKLLTEIETRIAELRDPLVLSAVDSGDSPIIGNCPAMVEVRRQVAELGNTRDPALLTSEMFTGKTLAAQTIHQLRYGTSNAFRLVLCEEESDRLERGQESRLAEVMQAHDCGTIYVSGVDKASPELQSALLSLDYSTTAGMCVIFGSRTDLHEMVDCGQFDATLYDRFENQHIRLPPLRDRREDLPLLIPHLFKRYFNQPSVRVSRRAWRLIEAYEWPANLHELGDVVRNGVRAGATAICLMDLPETIRGSLSC